MKSLMVFLEKKLDSQAMGENAKTWSTMTRKCSPVTIRPREPIRKQWRNTAGSKKRLMLYSTENKGNLVPFPGKNRFKRKAGTPSILPTTRLAARLGGMVKGSKSIGRGATRQAAGGQTIRIRL